MEIQYVNLLVFWPFYSNSNSGWKMEFEFEFGDFEFRIPSLVPFLGVPFTRLKKYQWEFG